MMRSFITFLFLCIGCFFSQYATANSKIDEVLSLPGILKQSSYWNWYQRDEVFNYEAKEISEFISPPETVLIDGEYITIPNQNYWRLEQNCLIYQNNKIPCVRNILDNDAISFYTCLLYTSDAADE